MAAIPQKSILIVDDAQTNITLLEALLCREYQVLSATDGPTAIEIATGELPPDMILLDVMMPKMNGFQVCEALKDNPRTQNIPILFVTGMIDEDDERKGLELGAVDYITKPFNPFIVRSRVNNHMELKQHRDHLEELVSERTDQLREGYVDTVNRLTMAAEYKDKNTGTHIQRISHYCRELALLQGLGEEYAKIISIAAPMHDIGKISIPDAILLKTSPLTDQEWEVMREHPKTGARILSGSSSPYLEMAKDIAASHHERWDGSGYPDGRKEADIPVAARIMTLGDQYDALRSRRPYKPPLGHTEVIDIMTRGDGRTEPEHFDPQLLELFVEHQHRFAELFEQASVEFF